MAKGALEYDTELGVWYEPQAPKPRAGRPPGSQPPRINWKDPVQRRAYKAAAAREYQARRISEALATGKKACTGPLCNGEVKPLEEFERQDEPGRRLPYSSHCRKCKNHARKLRYDASIERERQRSRDYYFEVAGRRRSKAHAAMREEAIAVYGGICVRCGCSADLEFDHVNDDGDQHRRHETGGQMIQRIARTGRRIDDYELQLLCTDCHKNKRLSLDRLRILMASSRDWPFLPA